MISDPLFYVAAVPAVVLVGLGKGGFVGLGSLALPLLALVTSPVRAAAVMLPILIVQDLVSVWAYRRRWDRRSRRRSCPAPSSASASVTCWPRASRTRPCSSPWG